MGSKWLLSQDLVGIQNPLWIHHRFHSPGGWVGWLNVFTPASKEWVVCFFSPHSPQPATCNLAESMQPADHQEIFANPIDFRLCISSIFVNTRRKKKRPNITSTHGIISPKRLHQVDGTVSFAQMQKLRLALSDTVLSANTLERERDKWGWCSGDSDRKPVPSLYIRNIYIYR